MLKLIKLIILCTIYTTVEAQSGNVQKYIDTYKDLAIREMKRTGVPAAIIIAQGILETESGNSDLVLKSNNHFGIKCKSNWTGGVVYHNDDEKGECFRKYNSADESYRDYSDFLKNSKRYESLFDLDVADYKGWAFGLKKAGYATNPRYPYILINSIERYKLDQYTIQGLSTEGFFDNGTYKDDNNVEKTASINPTITAQPGAEKHVVDINSNKTLNNGLRAVLAPAQTSLLAIAVTYDIPLKKLLEYNDMDTDGLLNEEQWIYLVKKGKHGTQDFHISQGESLHEVSQVYGIQLEYLKLYNSLQDKNHTAAGTRLLLRPGIEREKETVASQQRVHAVLPREGLYAISKKYNVSVKEIKEWNSLTSDDLQVGQQLIIK